MAIKIFREDGVYVAQCLYEDRLVLGRAGFKFNTEMKRWVTADDAVARKFYDVCQGDAKVRLDNIERLKIELVEASFAEDYDGELYCPAGLKYLPFQKAGIAFALPRVDTLIADQPGLGKSQNLDAKILTPTGWIRMGDISVGQKIIGRDGEEYDVTGVFPQGKIDAYKVSFRDGTSTICSLEHLWAVKDINSLRRGQDWRVKELKELLKWGIKTNADGNKWCIPLTEPVKFSKKQYSIEPYTLGVLLGDGYLSGTSIAFSCPDIDIEIAQRVEKSVLFDFKLNKNDKAACPQYIIARPYSTNKQSIYIQEIKRLGLRLGSFDKFIPKEYLLGSVEQRYALLQGLMDTDGSCINNRTVFHSLSPTLVRDVAELVRSLGGVAIIRSYDRTQENKGIEYQLNVKMFINPFYVPRKANKWSPANNNNRPCKYISEVEKLPSQMEMQCISVSSPDHLYITDDYIVTHNTIQALGVINNVIDAKKILIVVPASLKINWRKEANRWLMRGLTVDIARTKSKIFIDEEGTKKSKTEYFWPETDVIICNYEALQNYRSEIDNTDWDILICDESHVLKNAKAAKCIQVFGGGKGKTRVKSIVAKKRIFLTGTPILNAPLDMWVMIDNCNITEFGNYIRFIKYFCCAVMTPWGHWDTSGVDHLDEFQQILRTTFMIRRMKDDVLKDLPPKRRQVITLPQDGLSKVVKKEMSVFADNLKQLMIMNGEKTEADYEEMSDEQMTYLIDTIHDRTKDFDDTELTEYMATHFEAIAHAREEIGLAKLPMVIEYVKNLLTSVDKCVVLCIHRVIATKIAEAFPGSVKFVGGMSEKEKDKSVETFQYDPDCPLFVGNINAAGVGITLTAAWNLVMAELCFVPALLEQGEDRIHRIGQMDHALIHYLIVEGSLEQRLIEIIMTKQEMINEALNRKRAA